MVLQPQGSQGDGGGAEPATPWLHPTWMPSSANQIKKQKVFEQVQPRLRTDADHHNPYLSL